MTSYPEGRKFITDVIGGIRKNVKDYFNTITGIRERLTLLDTFILENIIPKLSPYSIINMGNGMRAVLDPQAVVVRENKRTQLELKERKDDSEEDRESPPAHATVEPEEF